jgi:hypothetical protein
MQENATKQAKPKKGKRAQPPAVDTAAEAAASTNGSTALATVEPAKRRAHRSPTLRTEEIEEAILDRLRDGETLREICKSAGMPRESAVRAWASEDTPFAEKYRRARELGYQKMADDLLEIADAKTGDPHRDRLRVETRKWILAKCLPRIYGDRLEVEQKGGIMIVKLDAEDLAL